MTAAIGLAEPGEIVRAEAPKDTAAYRELQPPRLEALYEMAYLRVFVEWESFLEASFLCMLRGYESPIYAPVFAPCRSRQRTLAEARKSLYGDKEYLLWHNPNSTMGRARHWFRDAPPHETVILSSLSRLEWFAAVRHRIVHAPDSRTRQKLDEATIGLAGRRYRGSSAGRFLRSWDAASSPQRRWIQSLSAELISLAKQISP